MTALKEAQQVGTFQPVTLVAYEAKIARLFDARDPESLEQRGIAPALLADPTWRDAMLKGRPAPSQTFGANLKADGVQGLLVQSFVTGADDQEVNIVVLAWNSADGCQLRVIDD
jgi:RES domain-containing protein